MVVALFIMGAIGATAAESITIINADFQQDATRLEGVAWVGGVTNWVSSNAGVQWDSFGVGGGPSNIISWINGGGWLRIHALDAGLGSIEVVSNQSITVTFDLIMPNGNKANSYAVDVFAVDGDLLASTGDIDISGFSAGTVYPAESHTLQWLGATPSTNGFDIVIRQPGGQILLDNVVASNDDPDPTPLPPVWSVNPITGNDGLVGHPYTGTLEGLASDPNWDVVQYSRSPSGDPWLVVAADGTLSGVPVGSGSYSFTVIASDGTLSSTATLNIEVGNGTAPVWDPNPIALSMSAFVGVPYTNSLAGYVIEPDGEPITYAIVIGPAWLAIDPSTGEIIGTPTEVGAEPNVFTIRATDLDGSDVATVNIPVIDGYGKIMVALDAGGAADGSDQTITDVSTGGESFDGTAEFTALGNAGWAAAAVGIGRWYDDEFSLDPAGTNVASYTFGNLTVGSEWEVYASWRSQAQGNNSSAVPYTINGGDPIYADQTQANPNDLTLHDGVQDVWFMKLGTATVGAEGTVIVTVSASSGGWTVCDAIVMRSTPVAPVDPVEDLTISGPVSSGTEMVLSWTALDKGTYGIETNSNLIIKNWQTFMSGLSVPGGGTITVTNTIGSDQIFYRVITE